MAEKKITRKIISLSKSDSKKDIAVEKKVIAEPKTALPKADGPVNEKAEEGVRTKKVCTFCQSKSNPAYTDIAVLRKYLTDRAKIVARSKNNLCSKHQRVVCKHIKYARHLALLSFVPKV